MPILLGGLLPGTILLLRLRPPPGQRRPGRASPPRTPALGFWLLAGLWCVFFFSLSGCKLPTYVLPAFPCLCLAVGDFVARTRWHERCG